MKMVSIEQELKGNSYPGRGIILGKTRTVRRQSPRTLSWDAVKTAGTVFLWRMAKEYALRRSTRPR